jgi:hypothetical protein
MHIAFVQVDSGVNGETYAHFDQSFTGFIVPAKGTANSGRFGNVLLTKGALNFARDHSSGASRRICRDHSHVAGHQENIK